VAFLGVVAGQVVGEQHKVPALVEQGFDPGFGRCVIAAACVCRCLRFGFAQVDQGKAGGIDQHVMVPGKKQGISTGRA